MRKLKTHSSLKKRIKISATGKIISGCGYARHNRQQKSKRSLKQNVGTKIASSTETTMIEGMRLVSLKTKRRTL
jgi:large subunit ribosomal protein L35